MKDQNQKQLGKTLWNIADTLRGAMNADDFRDYMLSFLFLRYLSDNYEMAAKKELGRDYPDPNAIGNGGRSPLSVWYAENPDDIGLPANLFYSTGIPVCILVLKKCKKPDDVLFINAAEHFFKDKRQNKLGDGKSGTQDHIGKIVSTYQFRTEEDRYSKRVSMDRIAEEGFNLNISRYVSTAVGTEEIDLSTTQSELVEIQKQIGEATSKHNAFLKELGLSLLPGGE